MKKPKGGAQRMQKERRKRALKMTVIDLRSLAARKKEQYRAYYENLSRSSKLSPQIFFATKKDVDRESYQGKGG